MVYALLWWARGLLVFAILRKFLPECPSLRFCAGALTLVHSSDGGDDVGGADELVRFHFLDAACDVLFRPRVGLEAMVGNWAADRGRFGDHLP